jgi:sigma-54 specific flagellar transcriptional regulator A
VSKLGEQTLHELASNIIGISREISELRALIKTIGPTDSTVLISGDSGTGKELVAKALHRCSDRAGEPFIPVNCGAIPKDLLESELFGHRKGSFTGAISDRKGRFELADQGTIFLDEIGDMSMDLQVKLLRVLQERTIDPVGAVQSKPIDVRVIAATHKNLERLIAENKFRQDLFYRLNILPLEIKPLTERKEDIPILFQHFAKLYAAEDAEPISLHKMSAKLMLDYQWPGNVRELSNLVDRYTALYPQREIDFRKVPPAMLPPGMRAISENANREALYNVMYEQSSLDLETQSTSAQSEPHALQTPASEVEEIIMMAQGISPFPEEGLPLKEHLVEIECSLIKQALSRASGNVSKTARLLNLQRTTLIEKINKYGLTSAS